MLKRVVVHLPGPHCSAGTITMAGSILPGHVRTQSQGAWQHVFVASVLRVPTADFLVFKDMIPNRTHIVERATYVGLRKHSNTVILSSTGLSTPELQPLFVAM